MKGVDLTPGSNGGFKKPQTTLSSVPVMTNIPSLSCGCEGSAEDLRLAQFRIFCSESEPKVISGQGKAPIFYGYPCTRVSYKRKNPCCLENKSWCHRMEGPTHLTVGSSSLDLTRTSALFTALFWEGNKEDSKEKLDFLKSQHYFSWLL